MLPDDPVSAANDLIAKGRAADAATLLERCMAANRGGLLLRLTLQRAFAAKGDRDAALAAARETALLYREAAPAALALGEALRSAGHLPAAVGELQRALRLDPALLAARVELGAAWLDAGEAGKALACWRGIRCDEITPELALMTADAERALASPRSDPRYVRHLFDQFSKDYDARMLAQLAYRAPTILREFAGLLGLGGPKRHDILDLGCGTGLMGEAVKDWAQRLDGVDLSPQMIERARARNIYDELYVADVIAWLAQPGSTYDLIFAADTIVYIGDLAPLFWAVRARLVEGGIFLFTAESQEGSGFGLGPKRRWRHSETYLRCDAERARLHVSGLMACVPRTEAGESVSGWAVALMKDTPPSSGAQSRP
ncbi:MAG TPA: methyltransferase domain-containing protein [Rhizomicrobium sp.]|nr:methyltransferase domain-containing protein [Rhizomicrobium sp.]